VKKQAHVLITAAVCLTAALFTLSAESRAYSRDPGERVYQKNSLYNNICVHQNESVVTLTFGRAARGGVQSQADVHDPRRHMLEYTRMTFCGLLYHSEPNAILVLGLGGGVIPRELRHYFPEATIDVAEIDAEVLRVAREYFHFKEDAKLKVHVEDGRMFVRKRLRDKGAKYDMVILDAFTSEYIPYHLMTREFLEQVKGILAEEGVIVANVFYTDRLFEAELATFMSTVGDCQVYLGFDSGNAMIVAAGEVLTPQQAAGRATALQSKHGFSFDLVAVAQMLEPDITPGESAIVLTDDRAPVNWLRSQPSARRRAAP